ncbi:hypothetical protein XELAEV_18025759mg [Xenopus laevis]|uniref:Uncharacterized protein n=1 Tax=Xenopus laevis TaxID=8355 RepID=A0A974HM47_XENLA|nr:hypothetical protein XELAEV_18025759mg [Xenopus laevis]
MWSFLNNRSHIQYLYTSFKQLKGTVKGYSFLLCLSYCHPTLTFIYNIYSIVIGFPLHLMLHQPQCALPLPF